MNPKKYNLLIDCSLFNINPSYIESMDIYAIRLLQGFKDSPTFNLFALVNQGSEDYLDSLARFKVPKIVIDINSRVSPSKKIDRMLGLIPFKKQLQKYQIDIVLSPYTIGYMNVFPAKYHQHAIIHDLIPIHNKSTSLFYLYMYKRVLRQIQHLISISEKTHQDVKTFIHRDSDVVYNSVFFDLTLQETPIKEVENKKYILDVNRFVVYKNAETLVRAYNLIKDQIPHYLYLKGLKHDLTFFEHLESVIKELDLTERVILDTQHRSEEEMRYLYRNASLFVTPSLIEGFGYTPIEAIIIKVPTLISDIETLKEVTKGKIASFNPHSCEELAQKIKEMIDNPPSEEERSKLSAYYLEEYSLKKQVNHLTEVLLNHLSNPTIV